MDYRNRVDNDSENQLTRVKVVPEKEIEQLQQNEIGIKADLKGIEIKQCLDNAIYKLIEKNFRKITLKAIGNATMKALSLADMLKRKIKGLEQVNYSYVKKYISYYESQDVIIVLIKETY